MTKIYAVGDLQGCSAQLDELVSIMPDNAKLICLGDLVNRGPDSLGTLRRLKSWQEAGKVECILGNHDLNLLARDAGLRGPKALDTLDDILNAPDRAELIDWLRFRPMALSNGKALFVHAGVYLAPSAYEAGFTSIAHDNAVIDEILVATDKAMKTL